MPPDLPATYYLDNVLVLFDHVEAVYADLLDDHELGFLTRFDRLGDDARKLYIRLLNRTHPCFRLSKLHYVEIGQIDQAIGELAAAGCIAVDGDIDPARLISLYSKPELLELHDERPKLAKLPRSELDQTLLVQDQAEFFERLKQQDCLLEVFGKDQYLFMQMLFFGNLNQSMTDFVLSDLGLYQYESYVFDQAHRPYRSRIEIKQHWLLYQLEILIEVSALTDLPELVELDQMIPPDIEPNAPGYGKSERLRYALARQIERIGELDQAIAHYQQCRRPPARERIARIYNQQAFFEQSLASCQQIIEQPINEEEQQFALQFAARLSKRHGFDPIETCTDTSAQYQPPMINLELAQQASVEIAVAEHFQQLDRSDSSFFLENSLFNGVLGLLIWEIIFAPVSGAFFNPFQQYPADFYSDDFMRRRQPLFDELWASLASNDDIRQLAHQRWQQKSGLMNPLVNWQQLSLDIIETALQRIEFDHWCVIFKRILQDLRANRSGFPDLIRFPPEGGYCLIEVKGPGDSLQKNQQRWMHFFDQHQIPHQLAKVTWTDR